MSTATLGTGPRGPAGHLGLGRAEPDAAWRNIVRIRQNPKRSRT